MQLLVMSDLHIEKNGTSVAGLYPGHEDVDVVLLVGDVGIGLEGIRWARDAFEGKRIVYIPGNHEFRGEEYFSHCQAMRREGERLGVDVLQGESITIAGVRIVGATLWTDWMVLGEVARDVAEREALQFGHDFKFTRVQTEQGERLLLPADVRDFHRRDLAAIKALASDRSVKTVVATHFAPSGQSLDPMYERSGLSPYYASNLDEVICDLSPVLWVHGHTHRHMDYMAGDTRVICNPHGYFTENQRFDHWHILEI